MRANRLTQTTVVLLVLTACAVIPAHGQARDSGGATSSLLVQAMRRAAQPGPPGTAPPPPGHAMGAVSLFRVPALEPRLFQKHDLVQIVVRETSTAISSQELETSKELGIAGVVDAWPHLSLSDILELQLRAGNTPSNELPEVAVGLDREFYGEGDYERLDDLTARLTAEVIEVLPNGNLVLEARTRIATDEETSTLRVTGICRPDDVTELNTIFSNQVHDLQIRKMHEGELKKASTKGIVTQVLDALFAW
jgi:flagellar L-ring protein precursor FlgH